MHSEIEQNVMARVSAIYIGRILFGATALKLYSVCLSLTAIASLVSISDVAGNLYHVGISGMATFLFAAFMQTTVFVQFALLVGLIAGVWFAMDLSKKSNQRFAL